MPFQSTRPVWGATPRGNQVSVNDEFQSTRPVWGATRRALDAIRGCAISIHAPRVGRDKGFVNVCVDLRISIHAPRVGRDPLCSARSECSLYFNPRAPCGARREANAFAMANGLVFQSTRPVWGATSYSRAGRFSTIFQSTRPVWGATSKMQHALAVGAFQSTRPVWGATSSASSSAETPTDFNPRAPCGARRQRREIIALDGRISIHAPRVGRDAFSHL